MLPAVNAQGSYTHQFLNPIHATLAGLAGNPAATPPPLFALPLVSPPADAFGVGGTVSWTAVNPRGIYGVGTANRAIEATQLSFEDQRRQIASSPWSTLHARDPRGDARVAELESDRPARGSRPASR